jgi:SAM-dependent methyltransferase
VLLAQAGYDVHGVDLSEGMVAAAKAKVTSAGVSAEVQQGDAAFPRFELMSFDVVFARHVLWALPDPEAALARWTRLLRPGGRLVLVEGRWFTGAGFTAARCQELVAEHRSEVTVRPLDDPRLWGHAVSDERYMLTSPHPKDRDGKFSGLFDEVFTSSDLRIIKTPIRSRRANRVRGAVRGNATPRVPRPLVDLRATAPVRFWPSTNATTTSTARTRADPSARHRTTPTKWST